MASEKIRITLVKSAIRQTVKQQETLKGLGLRRLNQTVERLNTREIRGMVKKVMHLVRVEE